MCPKFNSIYYIEYSIDRRSELSKRHSPDVIFVVDWAQSTNYLTGQRLEGRLGPAVRAHVYVTYNNR